MGDESLVKVFVRNSPLQKIVIIQRRRVDENLDHQEVVHVVLRRQGRSFRASAQKYPVLVLREPGSRTEPLNSGGPSSMR